ncbi:MAG: hypothetical protein ACI84C_002809 [Flavobacteriales bacterium]|jgi:hypothetical protein
MNHYEIEQENKASQYASRNQPRPTGWEDMVAEAMKAEYWTLGIATNLLCELRPDRTSYSVDPTKSQAELESKPNEIFCFSNYPWIVDEVEGQYYDLFYKLKRAIELKKVPSIEDERYKQSAKSLIMAGPSGPQAAGTLLFKPRDCLEWASTQFDQISDELLKYIDLTKPRKDPLEEIRRLKQVLTTQNKREQSLIAILALMMEGHSDKYHTLMVNNKFSLSRIFDLIEGYVKEDFSILGFSDANAMLSERRIAEILKTVRKNIKKKTL